MGVAMTLLYRAMVQSVQKKGTVFSLQNLILLHGARGRSYITDKACVIGASNFSCKKVERQTMGIHLSVWLIEHG